MDTLGNRQKQVVKLLLRGMSNKQIALELGVSENTIEFHLRNIYAKLQVHSRTEAMVKLGKSVGIPQDQLRQSVVVFSAGKHHDGGISFQELNMKSRLFYYILAGVLFGAVYWFYFSASAKFFNGFVTPEGDYWNIWLTLTISFIVDFGVWLFPATIPAIVEYRHSQKISQSALAVIVVWVSTVFGYYISYLIVLGLLGAPQMEYLLLFNEHTPDFWQNWGAIFRTLIISDLVKWVVLSLLVGGVSGLLSSSIYAYWVKKTTIVSPAGS